MGFLSSLFSGAKNLFGGMGNMFGGGAQQAMQPSFAKPSGKANMLASIGGPNQSMPKQSSGGGAGNLMNSLFPGGTAQGLAGLALPFFGNMMAPKSPKTPDFSTLPSVQAFQSFRPGQSVSPEYQTMLQNNVDRVRQKRIKDLQQVYHSARPGTDYLSDTNYQSDLAELERGVQTQMSDDLARAEGTFSSQEQERLSEIAQMDIYSIMAQTGLDAQEANDFKEMFSNMGNMLLTNATKKPDDLSSLMSLFGR